MKTDYVILQPHLHFPVTEGGMDEAGVFPNVPLPERIAAHGDLRPNGWS